MMPTFCITSLPVITPRIARIRLSNAEASSLRDANVSRWTLGFDDRRGALATPLNDDSGTALSADERPDPLEEDRQTQTRLRKREDVDQGPRKPRHERLEVQLPALEDRVPGADHRHGPAIGVAERVRRRLPGHAARDRLTRVVTLLDRHLRDSREWLSVLHEGGRVPDHEDLRVARNGEVGPDLHPPRSVSLRPQPLAGRRGSHACGPDHGLAGDALPAHDHALPVDLFHGMPESHLDAEPLEPRLRSLRELVRERPEDLGSHVQQDYACRRRVDAPELRPEVGANDVRDGGGHLDARWPGPHQDEGQEI